MKLLLCSVYDAAVGAYLNPFAVRSEPEAKRSFSDAVGDANSPFCAHPEDYILYAVGLFDNLSGAFEVPDTPKKLITALEVRAPKEPTLADMQ